MEAVKMNRRRSVMQILGIEKEITSSPIGARKCNFPLFFLQIMTDRPALRVVTLPETDRIVQELHNFVVVMKMFVNYCTVNEGQTAYKNKGQLMQLIREAMYIFMNLYNLISFQRVASFCALRRGKCCSACKCRSPSYRQLHHDK